MSKRAKAQNEAARLLLKYFKKHSKNSKHNPAKSFRKFTTNIENGEKQVRKESGNNVGNFYGEYHTG